MEDKREQFEDYYYSKIGMCGCGDPAGVKNLLYELLKNNKDYNDSKIDYEEMKTRRVEIIKNEDPDTIFEFIFHVLGRAEMLEHGGSVYGSRLTEKGNEFLELLRELKDDDDY